MQEWFIFWKDDYHSQPENKFIWEKCQILILKMFLIKTQNFKLLSFPTYKHLVYTESIKYLTAISILLPYTMKMKIIYIHKILAAFNS